MFIPKAFRQENIQACLALMQAYPFATLVAQSDEGIEVYHLPMVLKPNGESGLLQGHIAKANPLWQKVASGTQVQVIFNGPNCYISPNHYPTKAEDGRAVPTWNYAVVHVQGKINFTRDPDWIMTCIQDLTSIHEADSATPWTFDEAPPGYIERMLPAIVGIEIEITGIQGKWKLSQNQPRVNQQGVINGLNALTPQSQQVATMVEEAMK
ncbi:FMN-binding negative transcriptional regulator [Motilimonas eburnea]|uniref:FMN-binding negative transcriptional regulator n=1 Tax=Motilimonas eburnea TaxID=1737488 RepID=UPI001E2FA245|nr:FMN-binding negative transcriptional regulator [Motilimonas eburnea]